MTFNNKRPNERKTEIRLQIPHGFLITRETELEMQTGRCQVIDPFTDTTLILALIIDSDIIRDTAIATKRRT